MLEQLDLNLLLVFDVLLRERSVTRAALKLGLGQSATSAALGRLRAHFGDPLFIRVPRGMEPTARARVLAGPVTAALAQLRAALDGAGAFDPATARRTFVVSGVDYLGFVMLPELVVRLQREAPGVDLRFRFIEKDALPGRLDSGEIDLAVAVLADLPKHIASEPLLSETFACVTRRDHPVVASSLSLEAYARYPHILVTQRGDATGAVDHALRQHGLSRRVAITVPQVALVPMLLVDTDMIATIGRRAANRLVHCHPLALHEPPLPLATWGMDLIWARRNDGDRGLCWLRQQFRGVWPALEPQVGRKRKKI